MSASTEILLDQIKAVKTALDEARATNQPTADLQKQLSVLNERLEKSQQALNESRVLKG